MEWIETGPAVEGRDPAQINPYEDWDTRHVRSIRDFATLWHPVYISLARAKENTPAGARLTLTAAAQRLRDILNDGAQDNTRAPEHTYRQLSLILDHGQNFDAARERMFIYRRSIPGADAIYAKTLIVERPNVSGSERLELEGIIETVHLVGAAIPGLTPSTLRAGERRVPIFDKGVVGTAPLVGVVDDEIGFLNSRFWEATAYSTRIERFWSMGLENFVGAPPGTEVPFGRSLTKDDIDAMLARIENGRTELEE